MTLIIGLPMIFVAFPYYEGYRIANGVWRYHYFTNQETSGETILVTNIEADSGRKSNFSRVTMTVYVNSEKRIVNISNSNKALVRNLREENKKSMILNGEVNKEGKIVFIR
ncbi:hypothetical protein ACVRXQ_00995 [Streptococcus panodentis]|uniref:hypothetical protein n=1 Tax=Streptococcus panodentis TaxID=1581472 RepID=UPI001FD97086|nr:hypothetical protein [Streptococcus panodentis]